MKESVNSTVCLEYAAVVELSDRDGHGFCLHPAYGHGHVVCFFLNTLNAFCHPSMMGVNMAMSSA